MQHMEGGGGEDIDPPGDMSEEDDNAIGDGGNADGGGGGMVPLHQPPATPAHYIKGHEEPHYTKVCHDGVLSPFFLSFLLHL
jgi:hypothetical protein